MADYTDIQLTSIAPGAWRLSFSAPGIDPPISVWMDGAPAAVFHEQHTTYMTVLYTEEPLTIDIVQGVEQPPAQFPARVTLGWYRSHGAHRYRIDRYISDAWAAVDRIPDTYTLYGYYTWYYTWRSPRLPDGEEARFRVVPEGPMQAPGTAAELRALMVRYPDPPAPTYAYDDETRKLTLTET